VDINALKLVLFSGSLVQVKPSGWLIVECLVTTTYCGMAQKVRT